MMIFLKTIKCFLENRAKVFLRPILNDLPPPYNPHRSENRILFFLASVLVTLLLIYNLGVFFFTTSTSHIRNPSSSFFMSSSSPVTTTGLSSGASIAPEYQLAYRESLGFFDDVPEDVWREKKRRVRDQPRHNDAKLGLRSKFADREHASIWYQNNWEADFTCPHEQRIGGSRDGAKWTCDPHRIQSVAKRRQQQLLPIQPQPQPGDKSGQTHNQQIEEQNTQPTIPTNPCLVYSIGHHGRRPRHQADPSYFDFSFEQALLSPEYLSLKDAESSTTTTTTASSSSSSSPSCEIHIFDSWLANYKGPSPPNLILHPWGIEGEQDAHLGRRDFMTLAETVDILGHHGREVDVFKVDCEACEWHTYREWFDHGERVAKGKGGGIVMRQILVELHGAPRFEDDFFETMEWNGFVVFHREADTQYAGIWQEYSFLRMAPEFFEET